MIKSSALPVAVGVLMDAAAFVRGAYATPTCSGPPITAAPAATSVSLAAISTLLGARGPEAMCFNTSNGLRPWTNGRYVYEFDESALEGALSVVAECAADPNWQDVLDEENWLDENMEEYTIAEIFLAGLDDWLEHPRCPVEAVSGLVPGRPLELLPTVPVGADVEMGDHPVAGHVLDPVGIALLAEGRHHDPPRLGPRVLDRMATANPPERTG